MSYRCCGPYVDAPTKLANHRLRWLDPETGSWLSRDPLGVHESPNLYQGFLADPLRRVDPWGLRTEFWPSGPPSNDPLDGLWFNKRGGHGPRGSSPSLGDDCPGVPWHVVKACDSFVRQVQREFAMCDLQAKLALSVCGGREFTEVTAFLGGLATVLTGGWAAPIAAPLTVEVGQREAQMEMEWKKRAEEGRQKCRKDSGCKPRSERDFGPLQAIIQWCAGECPGRYGALARHLSSICDQGES